MFCAGVNVLSYKVRVIPQLKVKVGNVGVLQLHVSQVIHCRQFYCIPGVLNFFSCIVLNLLQTICST